MSDTKLILHGIIPFTQIDQKKYILFFSGPLMQFSMQKSVITEMDGADIWRSEMEARMALKDYESALALAQSAILKEDRLHLLSIIARMKQEQGLLPEQELMEQIVSLYDQIDQGALGERAVEIGSNLICCNPDLAIKMVETSTSTPSHKFCIHYWQFKISKYDIIMNPFLRL